MIDPLDKLALSSTFKEERGRFPHSDNLEFELDDKKLKWAGQIAALWAPRTTIKIGLKLTNLLASWKLKCSWIRG